jgi:penicillin-binding protein 2
MRYKIIENLIIIFLVLISLALGYAQILKGEHYYFQSLNNRIRVIPIEGPRGKIADRNGLILAKNRMSYNLGVVP